MHHEIPQRHSYPLTANLILLTALFVAFVVKLNLYWGFAYTSDMFTAINASRTFLYGYPLFYDPRWGVDSWHHNHFLLLAFGPATALGGGLGLLLGYFAIYSFAALRVLRKVRPSLTGLVLTLIWVTGPLAFWIVDDPLYGFHPESFYIPLALLLGVNLLENRRKEALLWGTAIVLNREDGAVLLSSLLVTWTFFNLGYSAPRPSIRIVREICTIVVLGMAFTVIGQVVLRLFGGEGRSLATQSASRLSLLWSDSEAQRQLFQMIKGTFLCALAGILPLASKLRMSSILSLCIGIFPLVLVTILASLPYFPDMLTHGMTWTPRFSIVYAFLVFWSLLVFARSELSHLGWVVTLSVVAFFAQVDTLKRVRSYIIFDRLGEALYTNPRERYSKEELNLLNCLNHNTLRRTNFAAVPILLESSSDKHVTVNTLWALQTGLQPAFFVCDTLASRMPMAHECANALSGLQNSNYMEIQAGALVAKYDPNLTLGDTCANH